jgi:biotin synthase
MIISLLQLAEDDTAELFALADRVRAQYMGNGVHLRGIIEFSNFCRQDCLYCGLRRSNDKLSRYRLTPDELLAAARRAGGLGYRTLVLQSGEDLFYTAESIGDIIRRIKRELDVAVTLSVGEREYDEYAKWRKAGADRYLLKHETADPVRFAALRPGTTLAGRVGRLKQLRRLGYQIGSGCMVGLRDRPRSRWPTTCCCCGSWMWRWPGSAPSSPTKTRHWPPPPAGRRR